MIVATRHRAPFLFFLSTFLIAFGFWVLAFGKGLQPAAVPSVTVLCYLNGDNDLAEEALHTLDMIETVGSSDRVKVIALVDGHPDWLGQYDLEWSRARLLQVEFDAQIGVINSPVLADWGEANLGHPETLERFVGTTLDRYPADRYFFYVFAHSQGIIDTRTFAIQRQGKAVSISRDDTSGEKMQLERFQHAIKRGLQGQRFELLALFSCLANMVEIGYALSDVTRYFVASQDEIRLLNEPPGSFQIRGLQLEAAIAALIDNTAVDARDLGRMMVDTHVDSYMRGQTKPFDATELASLNFSAGMALVDCAKLPYLVETLDGLARSMMVHVHQPDVVRAMLDAQEKTPRYASFLNLEYYDLFRFVWHLRANVWQADLRQACTTVLNQLTKNVLLYERHTLDTDAKGVSIYLSSPLVPDNIYRAHQCLYARSIFCQDTQWDEMIDCFRLQVRQCAP